MQKWFQFRGRLIRVEHANLTLQLWNSMLEIDDNRLNQWLKEGEYHVDFCVFP
jgi:hypothetical protein